MAHSVGCSCCCCSCDSSRADAGGESADKPAAGIVVALACGSNWATARRTAGEAADCLAATRSGADGGEEERGAGFGAGRPSSDADWDGCDLIDSVGVEDCAGRP